MKELEPESVVLIVGAATDKVQTYLGSSYAGLPITYITQDPPRGLLDAVYQTRDIIEDKFVTLLSDEIYIGGKHQGFLKYWHTHPETDGLVGYIANQDWADIRKNYSIVMSDGRIERLQEKPKHQVNDLLGTGTWGLNKTFFNYAARVLSNHPPEKRSFTDALQLMIDDNCLIQGYNLASKYINVNSPPDVPYAEKLVAALC